MAQTIAGETGTLAGYNLNVICTATPGNESTSQSQDYNVSMTITDNLNSLSIWKSYGFNVNNSATLGPFSTFVNGNTQLGNWPLLVPNKTTYKTNGPFSPDSVLGGGYYTWNAYTANINGNPLPSNGILSPPSVNFGLGMSFVNNISIRVTVIDEVRIEPIPFILDMVSLGNSAFITPLPLPYGQISTVTLPLSFGQIANSWTLSIILPNGTTITLQSFGDGKGNATFWWQNNMVGSYFLTATNSFSIPNTSVNGNWSTSIRYSVNVPQTAKYKKLIKKSAILAKNK